MVLACLNRVGESVIFSIMNIATYLKIFTCFVGIFLNKSIAEITGLVL